MYKNHLLDLYSYNKIKDIIKKKLNFLFIVHSIFLLFIKICIFGELTTVYSQNLKSIP
jgi:hypothetical protein